MHPAVNKFYLPDKLHINLQQITCTHVHVCSFSSNWGILFYQLLQASETRISTSLMRIDLYVNVNVIVVLTVGFLLHRYKLSLLKPSVKALAISTRVSIRTDNRGFLSLQYMIKIDDGQVCFVEYYVSIYLPSLT